MAHIEPPPIPSIYQEKTYIASSGTQYIDTGFIPNQDTTIKMDFMVTAWGATNFEKYWGSSDSGMATFICQNNKRTSDSRGQLFRAVAGNNNYNRYYAESLANSQLNTRYLMERSCDKFYINNVLQSTSNNEAFQCVYTLNLCATHNSSGAFQYSKIRIYSCQLYDGNTLERDLVPVLRIADSKPGLWDKVHKVFYTNQGTGNFSYG